MILAKETTVWDCEHRQPNHTYLMSDTKSKIYGYFKFNQSKEFTMFKKPIRIDTRYRKFVVIKSGIKDIE
jgi:hypothetical protein